MNASKEVRVDHVGACRAHAVGELLVNLERAVLELRRQPCGIGDRHNLIVVAVHHERRHIDALEVRGKALSIERQSSEWLPGLMRRVVRP